MLSLLSYLSLAYIEKSARDANLSNGQAQVLNTGLLISRSATRSALVIRDLCSIKIVKKRQRDSLIFFNRIRIKNSLPPLVSDHIDDHSDSRDHQDEILTNQRLRQFYNPSNCRFLASNSSSVTIPLSLRSASLSSSAR